MISYEEALKLLKEKIKDEIAIQHAITVSELSCSVAKTIKGNNPMLKLNPEVARIAGLLHDIGKCVNDSYDTHAYNSGIVLKKMGEKELAEIAERHWWAHEIAKEYGIKGNFIQRTLNDKIITYADMRAYTDIMSVEMRLKNVRERYFVNEKIRKAYIGSLTRMKKIVREIESLIGLVEINAPAKINLTLDVLGMRKDGFHEIKSVMAKITLYDEIKVLNSVKRRIVCNNPAVPVDENNICWKAVDFVKKEFNIKKEVEIIIDKKIPVGAGLAGGSADAAVVLIALNKLWKLGLNEKQLLELGKQLGSDVPFCMKKGNYIAEGRGETLKKIKIPKFNIVLVNPGFEISAKEAYMLFDKSKLKSRNSTAFYLKGKDIKLVGNDLDGSVLKEYPVVSEMKKELIEHNAIVAQMSGSGPSVFGMFRNRKDADIAYRRLNGRFAFCWQGEIT
ncbi:4-(cytidine 5'-diphospho)-2-C-methyl-D-erythritol kinase [Candidatus Woesearchaeota archaeon]|nr:4-(cytidine 5'-diphospho)-2-C-methyl-D-erythritol kinase [Candidatus Woesearchaeota archaeon]